MRRIIEKENGAWIEELFGGSKKEYFAKYDEEIEYERPGLDFTLFAWYLTHRLRVELLRQEDHHQDGPGCAEDCLQGQEEREGLGLDHDSHLNWAHHRDQRWRLQVFGALQVRELN